jgi:hypothetical protein
MKYKRYITIAIILLAGFKLSAQENFKLCPYDIKELLVNFDKYSNFESDTYQRNIASLFYYDENSFGSKKIIPNVYIDWFGDNGGELLTMGEFAAKYKTYFTNKEIKYDTLLNDRIVRDYNLIGYKISVVKVTKEVKYIDRSKGGRAWQLKPEKKDADLYFSIITVKTKNRTTVNKIVRITNIVPNYDWYTPQQVGLSFTPAKTWITSDKLASSSDFGFRFKASANYTLTGKNYFNLFLSPGLGFQDIISPLSNLSLMIRLPMPSILTSIPTSGIFMAPTWNRRFALIISTSIDLNFQCISNHSGSGQPLDLQLDCAPQPGTGTISAQWNITENIISDIGRSMDSEPDRSA